MLAVAFGESAMSQITSSGLMKAEKMSMMCSSWSRRARQQRIKTLKQCSKENALE